MLWIEATILFFFVWIFGTRIHWWALNIRERRIIEARTKIWDVQPAWTGPELRGNEPKQLPKEQGPNSTDLFVEIVEKSTALGHAEAAFTLVHAQNKVEEDQRALYNARVDSLKKNIDKLEKMAVKMGALSNSAKTVAQKRPGRTYKNYYYAPVESLPESAREGRRVETPDGTLWIRGRYTWDREWYPLMANGKRKEPPLKITDKLHTRPRHPLDDVCHGGPC